MLERHARVAAHALEDVALGDDLDLVLERGGLFQCNTQHFFGHVAAVDVGLIHRGDALFDASFDLGLHMGGRGVGVIGQPPHAIDDARQIKGVGKRYAFHLTAVSCA